MHSRSRPRFQCCFIANSVLSLNFLRSPFRFLQQFVQQRFGSAVHITAAADARRYVWRDRIRRVLQVCRLCSSPVYVAIWFLYSHTHPIHTGKPLGIPPQSPYPVFYLRNPKILHTYSDTHASFRQMHIFCSLLCRPLLSVYLVCTVQYCHNMRCMKIILQTDPLEFITVPHTRLWTSLYHGTSANASTAASTHGHYARRLRHCSSNRSLVPTSRNVLFDVPRRLSGTHFPRLTSEATLCLYSNLG